MRKNKIGVTKALVIAVGLAVIPASNAYMMLDTDLNKFQTKMQDNMNRMMEAAQKMAAEMAKLQAYGQAAQDKVDAANNGFANMIARTQQAATDVFNLDLLSKSRPVQDACRSFTVQHASTATACIENDVQELIRGKLRATTKSLVNGFKERAGSLKDNLFSDSGVGSNRSLEPYRIANASQPGQQPPKNKEPDIEVYYREMEALIDKHVSLEKQGINPSDPRLLLVTNSIAPVYDEKELETTLNAALITYPRFVRKHNDEAINERELFQDMRKNHAMDSANEVVARHIAMRTPTENGMPSKLMALTLPAMLYLDADSELFPDGKESWMKKVTLNMDTTPGEISRDKTILKAIKLEQAFEAYKSSLIVERLLLNMYLSKVEKF